MLHTLGGLRWAESAFRREKPLLLLAYLALEGPQPRPRLARLFWPDAANPANSLAQHLVRLKPLCAVQEYGKWVRASAECDAAVMRQHLETGQWQAGLALYGGAFLDGLNLDLSPDVDEWILDTRETLAAQAQAALLTLARQAALELDPAGAARFAERCHTLPGAAPLEDNALNEVYGFLARAHHPHAEALRHEARELGLTLHEPVPVVGTTPPKFHLLLALTDHLPAIRAALRVSAAELTRLRCERQQAGEAAYAEALAWLEAHPLEAPLLHLEVARHLPVGDAWPHFDASRELWEDGDADAVAAAAHYFADKELRRGYPARAVRVLEGVKQTDEVKLLRAWGLIHGGRKLDALVLLQDAAPTEDNWAAQATALAYLGRYDEAEQLAGKIKKNASPAHAHAETVFGFIAKNQGLHELACSHYQSAVGLWCIHDKEKYLKTASALAAARIELGIPLVDAFQGQLAACENYPLAKIETYLNYSHALKQLNQLEEAKNASVIALEASRGLEYKDYNAIALNNIGVINHLQKNFSDALTNYKEALQYVQGSENLRLTSLIVANISELEGDVFRLSRTLSLLYESGHQAYAEDIRKNILLEERIF